MALRTLWLRPRPLPSLPRRPVETPLDCHMRSLERVGCWRQAVAREVAVIVDELLAPVGSGETCGVIIVRTLLSGRSCIKIKIKLHEMIDRKGCWVIFQNCYECQEVTSCKLSVRAKHYEITRLYLV